MRARPAALNPAIRKHSTFLALLLACVVLLPLLGHRVLTAWDEGIYAEIAREMLAGGTISSWIIPHWNGHLWFEKPPLQMWLTATSLRVLGLNALADRLPSALAGVASVGILHAWLQRRQGFVSAWLATFILLSAFGFQHVARVGETDALLTLFSLLAVIGLADLLLANPRGWPLFFGGLGLSVITKGAAALPLLLTPVLLASLARRRLFRYPRVFFTGCALFFLLTVPWHLYAYLHFGRLFYEPYLGFHVLQRAASAIEGHKTPPWFYLWVLLVSAPFFSLLLPSALVASFRNRDLSPLLPFSAFVLLELLFFSAVRTRLPHYIAPVYPGIAAVTGSWLAPRLAHPTPGRYIPPARLAFAAVVGYVLLAALTSKPRRALHAPVLGPGLINPDNRESAGLLQRLHTAPQPLPDGPLLVWSAGPVVPLTTDAFYARRLVQQVSLNPAPADTPVSIYFNDPTSLTGAVPAPRLILLDNSLLALLDEKLSWKILFSGPSQTLAIASPKS